MAVTAPSPGETGPRKRSAASIAAVVCSVLAGVGIVALVAALLGAGAVALINWFLG